MSHRPKVSVILSSYNHARFLPQALDSVLAQTYRDFEILLTDDGSSDGSLEIAREYEARHPSVVRVFTHPGNRNLGISATCNLSLSHMRGEYWGGLASDDVWYPDKLARQVAFLDERPGVGLVYGYAHIIDEDGRRLPGTRDDDDISSEPDPAARLIAGNVISGGTCLVRSECVRRVGPYDVTLIYSDWELWVRILSHWGVGYMDLPLAMYRHHGGNTSVGAGKDVHVERAIQVLFALQRKADSVGGRLARSRTRLLLDLQLAFLQFCKGDSAEAAERLHSAFGTDSSRRDIEYVAQWLTARRGDKDWVLPLQSGAAARDFHAWFFGQLPSIAGQIFTDALKVTFDLTSELALTKDWLRKTQDEVASMQSSKFWKLRAHCLRLRELVRLP